MANYSPLLAAALDYAALDWHVLPLYEPDVNGRCPHCRNLPHTASFAAGRCPRIPIDQASADPNQLTAWWTQWPNANLAIALGPSRLVVLDVDIDPLGKNLGEQTILSEAGPDAFNTLTSRTGSGGTHLYFAAPAHPITASFMGLGAFSYVHLLAGETMLKAATAPPSVTSAGVYTWEGTFPTPQDITARLASLPDALAARLTRR